MNSAEHNRLWELCYRSKKGGVISDEDQDWLKKMHKLYPNMYRDISRDAAEEAQSEVNPF